MKAKKVTVADLRRAIANVAGNGEAPRGFAVEVRPNGAAWVYQAHDDHGVTPHTIPGDPAAVLHSIVTHVGAVYGFLPSIALGSSIDKVPQNLTRYPRIEVHPSMIRGV